MGLAEELFGSAEPKKKSLADELFGSIEPKKKSLADELFGSIKPKKKSLADELFGSIKPKKKSLADDLFGSSVVEADPLSIAEQMTSALPGLAGIGARAGIEHAKKLKQREKFYEASAKERAITAPVKVFEKAEKLKARIGEYAKKRKAEGYPHAEAKTEEAIAEIEELAKPAKSALERQKFQREMAEHWKKVGPGRKPGLGQIAAAPGQPLPPPSKGGGFIREMEKPFGIPFRALGGALKSAQGWARYAAKSLAGGAPEEMPEMPYETVAKSVIAPFEEFGGAPEEATYTPAIFIEAAKSLKSELVPGVVRLERATGKISPEQILTPNEEMAAAGMGLFSELFGWSPVLKAARLGRGGPGYQAVSKHARKALKKVGAKISKEEAQELGRLVMEAPTNPEAISEFHSHVFKTAKKLGLDDVKAAQAAREGLRRIGAEGKYLTKKGLRLKAPVSQQKAMEWQVGEAKRLGKEVPGVPEAVSKEIPPRLVPLGAAREKRSLRRIPGLGKLFYGGGAARGTTEAMRPGTAYTHLKGMEGTQVGRMISKKMGTPAAEAQLGVVRDLRSNLAQKDQMIDKVRTLRESLAKEGAPEAKLSMQAELEQAIQAVDEAESQLQVAYKRAGLTEAEVRTGFKAETKGQQQAAQAFEQGMAEANKIEQEVGLRHGEVESYMPRIETPEAKQIRRETRAGRIQAAKYPFMRKRQGYLSTSVAGTRNREFVQEVGPVYASRMRGHAVAVGNKMSEDAIIRGYGSSMLDDMVMRYGVRDADELATHLPFLRDIEKLGLVTYRTQLGVTKGKWYILDKGTAGMLNKALNPERYGEFIRNWSKLHNWWKGWATILRPGFVVRNVFFGNVWNAWIADVDIVTSPYLAMQIQTKLASRSPSSVMRTIASRMAAGAEKAIPKLAGKKIGKYTLDDIARMGVEDGVPAGGFFGAELGSKSYKFPLMTLNKKLNTLGEDNFRWAVYIDRLRKGYSRREAMAEVARICFNYNEIAEFGAAARNIWSFSTWNLKNWGLQITNLMNRPDRYMQFVRAWTGIQDIDPLDPEELEAIPDNIWGIAPFFVPKKRSEKGHREWLLGSGLFPALNLMQLTPERIWATAGEMINPLIRGAIDSLSFAAEKERPPYWGSHPRDPTVHYTLVPGWVEGLMDTCQLLSPRLYDLMSWSMGVVPVAGKHKWTKDTEEFFNLHPGIGTLGRVTRASPEQTYMPLIATALGVKLHELTPQRIDSYLNQKYGNILKKLKEKEMQYKELDIILDPKNPLRHVYP